MKLFKFIQTFQAARYFDIDRLVADAADGKLE
jgi:hypothetical protein